MRQASALLLAGGGRTGGVRTPAAAPAPTPAAADARASAIPLPPRPRDVPLDGVDPCALLTDAARAELAVEETLRSSTRERLYNGDHRGVHGPG